MKILSSLQSSFTGMGRSISRFPLTVLFLIAVALLNGLMIENSQDDYTRYLFTYLIGAALAMVGQMVYERFFIKTSHRYLIMTGVVLLTIIYYFIIGPQDPFNEIIFIKTAVSLFALMIIFIWIPSIKSDKVMFHHSFLVTLKAFLTSALYTAVLAAGISAIYYATDYLLFNIDTNILSHLLNLVGVLFAPIYCLSMTPLYPSQAGELLPNEVWSKPAKDLQDSLLVPRFLDILISYIIIPLTAIYTFILLVYVILNIGGEFWTDNLMEPLLVSYAVIVIIVYIIACNIDNQFTHAFKKIFPKILLPIVVFQTIASFLKIQEMGITHGRYYVIMFGIFATIAGLLFSFMKPKYNGLIAIALLVLSAISIIPPIDAFTISKNNQINLLEDQLTKNNILINGQLQANSDVPKSDQIIITKVASYIDNMGYDEDIAYLPADFNVYSDFEEIFGFKMTYADSEINPTDGQYAYLEMDGSQPITITDADIMLQPNLYYATNDPESADQTTTDFEVDGQTYRLEKRIIDGYYSLIIKDNSGEELMIYDTRYIYDQIFGNEEAVSLNLNLDDAHFTTENDQASLQMIVTSIDQSADTHSMSFYLFIDIKS